MELGRSSAVWRRLVSIREVAEPNIRWCLGEGLVDFWYDRWLQDDPLCYLYCRQDSPNFLVAEFFTGDKWNEAKLRLWLPEPIVSQVLQVHFDSSKKDSVVWSPSGGCFVLSLLSGGLS